jgi:MarR family transcriptional regulator, temperature-dependent positive regulator of motility
MLAGAFTVLPSHRVPAHLARRFHQICNGVTAEVLAGENLTPKVYGVLSAILESPGISQRQLASSFGVDQASIGDMVDELEARKLVERKSDKGDRRAWRLHVTRQGAAFRDRLRPTMLAAQEQILACLSRPERNQLIDMLVRILESNDAYARPGTRRRKSSKVSDS